MAPLKQADQPTAKTSPARPATPAPKKEATRKVASRGRASRQRRRIREIEKTEPLQRRILRALAGTPQTPSELVNQLDATKETISRLLSRLQQDALVEHSPVAGDARRKLYRLSPEGERTFGRHLAYGKADPLPAPATSEHTVALVRAGLENAVRMRRQANRLDDAAARMEIVLAQARELGDSELLIDTLGELATTLRQARRYEELEALLDELKRMALGTHPTRDPELAFPAAAHREYELGRLRGDAIGNVAARARHLDAAQSLFCQLGHSAEARRKATWVEREAWSVLSLASNLRERTHYERAIGKASWAMSRFQSIEDHYGQSRSLFMIGLCLRLMGDFRQAWAHLAQSLVIAQEHTFERFQADTLLQMGDVQRCMGQIAPARALLSQAIEQARRMDLQLMLAFAQSSLGACAYQVEDYERARAELNRAQVVFRTCAHGEGLALNTRRQAVVQYRLNEHPPAGALTTLRRAVGSAHKQYEDLHSPAGAAACDIQAGRLCLMLEDDPIDPVAKLKKRLDDPRQRDLIELDPWVPSYLLHFSTLVDDELLHTSAKGLVADGQRRRNAWFVQVMGPAALDSPVSSVDKGVLEMGGESRRDQFFGGSAPLEAIISSNSEHDLTLVGDLGQAEHTPLFVAAEQSIQPTVR
jgi:DNA-binding MarR family transcriptional regulator